MQDMVGYNLKSKTNADPCKRVGINLYGFVPDKPYFRNTVGEDDLYEAIAEYLWHKNPERDGIPDGQREDQMDYVTDSLPWKLCVIVTIVPKIDTSK